MMRLCFILQTYPVVESCFSELGKTWNRGPEQLWHLHPWMYSQLSWTSPSILLCLWLWLDQTNCNHFHAMLAIPETGMTQVSTIPELSLASTTLCKVDHVFSMRERKVKLLLAHFILLGTIGQSHNFRQLSASPFLGSQSGSSVTTEQSKRVHWGVSTQAEQTPSTSCICEIQLHHVLWTHSWHNGVILFIQKSFLQQFAQPGI